MTVGVAWQLSAHVQTCNAMPMPFVTTFTPASHDITYHVTTVFRLGHVFGNDDGGRPEIDTSKTSNWEGNIPLDMRPGAAV